MSAAYQHLALTEVKPGMIVSHDLLDQQGQVLLPKGAVLSARTIALLPSHGIDSLAVLRPDAAAPAPDPEQVERRLAALFRKHAPGDPETSATQVLRAYMTDYRLERDGTA